MKFYNLNLKKEFNKELTLINLFMITIFFKIQYNIKDNLFMFSFNLRLFPIALCVNYLRRF